MLKEPVAERIGLRLHLRKRQAEAGDIRHLIVHTSPTKRSSDFVAPLEQLDGPTLGRQAKPVVLVEDKGPIHVSKLSLAAGAQ